MVVGGFRSFHVVVLTIDSKYVSHTGAQYSFKGSSFYSSLLFNLSFSLASNSKAGSLSVVTFFYVAC